MIKQYKACLSKSKISTLININNNLNYKIFFFNNNSIICIKENSSLLLKFYKFIDWTNNEFKSCHLYKPSIINIGNYIFIESCNDFKHNYSYINNKSYFLIGQLLGLLYIFNAKNIKIAFKKQYPILIEIESILSSKIYLEDNTIINSTKIADEFISDNIINYNFLKSLRNYIEQEQIGLLKDGFYNICTVMSLNKKEIIEQINNIFRNIKNYNLLTKKAKINFNNLNINKIQTQLKYIDLILKKDTFIYKIMKNIALKYKKLDLISYSIFLGNYIIENSIIGQANDGYERTWISINYRNKNTKNLNFNIMAVKNSLYYGNGGIALFLLYVGYTFKINYFINTSKDAIKPLIEEIYSMKEDKIYSLEFYKGITGYLFVLYKFYTLTNNIEYLNAVNIEIEYIYNRIKNNNKILSISDIIGVMKIILFFNNNEFIYFSEKFKFILNRCIYYIDKIYLQKTKDVKYCSELLIYLSSIYNILEYKYIKNLIKKILNIQRSLDNKDLLKGINPEIQILSRIILKQNNYCDLLIENEIKSLLEIITNKNTNIYDTYLNEIIRQEIIEFCSNAICSKELSNINNLLIDNIIANLMDSKKLDLELIPKGLFTGISGIGYYLLKNCNSCVPSLIML